MDPASKQKLQQKLQDKNLKKSFEIRAIPNFFGSSIENFNPLYSEIQKDSNSCVLYVLGDQKNGLREVMKYTILGPWNSIPQYKKLKSIYNDSNGIKKHTKKEDVLKKYIEQDKNLDLSDEVNTMLIDSLGGEITKKVQSNNCLSSLFGKKITPNCKNISKTVAISLEMDAAIQALIEKLQCPCGKFIKGLEHGRSISCFSSEKKYCSFSCQTLFDTSKTIY